MAATLMLSTTSGCAGYGAVSPAAYDYATALYSISNRKAEDRLEQIDEQMRLARQAGELSPQESEWLHEILADARNGQWESANSACRRMMEDQVDQ